VIQYGRLARRGHLRDVELNSVEKRAAGTVVSRTRSMASRHDRRSRGIARNWRRLAHLEIWLVQSLADVCSGTINRTGHGKYQCGASTPRLCGVAADCIIAAVGEGERTDAACR